jgi:hypothetical protein
LTIILLADDSREWNPHQIGVDDDAMSIVLSNCHHYPIDNDVVSSIDWNILLVVVVAAAVIEVTTKRSVAFVLTPPFVFDSNDGKSFFWMTIIVVVIVVDDDDIVTMPQHG